MHTFFFVVDKRYPSSLIRLSSSDPQCELRTPSPYSSFCLSSNFLHLTKEFEVLSQGERAFFTLPTATIPIKRKKEKEPYSKITRKEEEWKSATATYTKETDGSIITANSTGLILQKELVVMGTFTKPVMGSTVLGIVPCYLTKGVPVELALRSDVLTTSCGVSKGAPQSSSLPQISVHRIMGFQQIMVADAISPRNTLRCLRKHLLKLQRKEQILCQFSIRGQPLSFEVTAGSSRTLASYSVAPANWQFGQTYGGKQFK
ncbi:hypothetical protein CRYUN_Cryun10bG0088900 [Craigia yunnanensis]